MRGCMMLLANAHRRAMAATSGGATGEQRPEAAFPDVILVDKLFGMTWRSPNCIRRRTRSASFCRALRANPELARGVNICLPHFVATEFKRFSRQVFPPSQDLPLLQYLPSSLSLDRSCRASLQTVIRLPFRRMTRWRRLSISRAGLILHRQHCLQLI
jgi:hypothetical protein